MDKKYTHIIKTTSNRGVLSDYGHNKKHHALGKKSECSMKSYLGKVEERSLNLNAIKDELVLVKDDGRNNDKIKLEVSITSTNTLMYDQIADVKLRFRYLILTSPTLDLTAGQVVNIDESNKDIRFPSYAQFHEAYVTIEGGSITIPQGKKYPFLNDRDFKQGIKPLTINRKSKGLGIPMEVDYAFKAGEIRYGAEVWQLWVADIKIPFINDFSNKIEAHLNSVLKSDLLDKDKYKSIIVTSTVNDLSLNSIPTSDKYNNAFYKWSEVTLSNDSAIPTEYLINNLNTFKQDVEQARDNYDKVLEDHLNISKEIDLNVLYTMIPKIVLAYSLKFNEYDPNTIGVKLDEYFKDKQLPITFSDFKYKIVDNEVNEADILSGSSTLTTKTITSDAEEDRVFIYSGINNYDMECTTTWQDITIKATDHLYPLLELVGLMSNLEHKSCWVGPKIFYNEDKSKIWVNMLFRRVSMAEIESIRILEVNGTLPPVGEESGYQLYLDVSKFKKGTIKWNTEVAEFVDIESLLSMRSRLIDITLRGDMYKSVFGDKFDSLSKISKMFESNLDDGNDTVSSAINNSLSTVNQLLASSISSYSDDFSELHEQSSKWIKDNSEEVKKLMNNDSLYFKKDEDKYRYSIFIAKLFHKYNITQYSENGLDHLANELDGATYKPSSSMDQINDKLGQDFESMMSKGSTFDNEFIKDIKPNDLLKRMREKFDIGHQELISLIRLEHFSDFGNKIKSILTKLKGISVNLPMSFFYRSIKSLNISSHELATKGLNSLVTTVNKLRQSIHDLNLSWLPEWQKVTLPSISNLYEKLNSIVKTLFDGSISGLSTLIHSLATLDFSKEFDIKRYINIIKSKFTQMSRDIYDSLNVELHELKYSFDMDFDISVTEISKAIASMVKGLWTVFKYLTNTIDKILGGIFEKMKTYDYDSNADPIDIGSLITVKGVSSPVIRSIVNYCDENKISISISNNAKSVKILIDPNGDVNIYASCTTPLASLPLLTGQVEESMGYANLGIYFDIYTKKDYDKLKLLSSEMGILQNLDTVIGGPKWLSWINPAHYLFKAIETLVQNIESELINKVKTADWGSIIEKFVIENSWKDNSFDDESKFVTKLPAFSFLNLRYAKKGTIIKFIDTFELIGLAMVIGLTVVTRGGIFAQTARSLSNLRKKRKDKKGLKSINNELEKLEQLEKNKLHEESFNVDTKELANSITGLLNS